MTKIDYCDVAMELGSLEYEKNHPKEEWPSWFNKCKNSGLRIKGKRVFIVCFSFVHIESGEGETFFEVLVDINKEPIETKILVDKDINSFNPQKLVGFFKKPLGPDENGNYRIT